MGDSSRVVAPKFVTRGWLTRGVEALLKQTHAEFLAIAIDSKFPWAKGHLLLLEFNHCEMIVQGNTMD